jgi:hypothetical protein
MEELQMKTMDEITIPAATITEEQLAYNMRQLAMSIVYQSVKDYCRSGSDKKRRGILNDLRSPYMDLISDGMSVIAAEQLEKDPDVIAERLKNIKED